MAYEVNSPPAEAMVGDTVSNAAPPQAGPIHNGSIDRLDVEEIVRRVLVELNK